MCRLGRVGLANYKVHVQEKNYYSNYLVPSIIILGAYLLDLLKKNGKILRIQFILILEGGVFCQNKMLLSVCVTSESHVFRSCYIAPHTSELRGSFQY